MKCLLRRPSNSKSGSFLQNKRCINSNDGACSQWLVLQNLKQQQKPVHDDQFNIHIFPIFVEKIRHEVGHGLVRDVATQDYVSGRRKIWEIYSCHFEKRHGFISLRLEVGQMRWIDPGFGHQMLMKQQQVATIKHQGPKYVK